MSIAAQSVADVEDQVTLPQLRILVLISSRGAVNLNVLAQLMGIHPSNATRACDRLVTAGFLSRTESPADRRRLVLELTDAGHALVDAVDAHRRTAIAAVLDRLPRTARADLEAAMTLFARAAGEASTEDAWQLGWPS